MYSAALIGQVNVKQAPYNAVGNGVANDTDALNNAAMAARQANVGLTLPSGTYRVTSSLDFTGIAVFGAGNQNTIIQADPTIEASTAFDVIVTKGNTQLSNFAIDGGWTIQDAQTTGNGISTLSNPGASPAYYGYNNIFENLSIQNVNRSCIYINAGAYETIRGVLCGQFGFAGLYLDSDNYPGFVTTTTVVDGVSTFSSKHPGSSPGYGIYMKDVINVAIRSAVIEDTDGVFVTGCNNRQIILDNVYQEVNAGRFLSTSANSCGIGISVLNSYGPGTTGVDASSLTNWANLTFYGNSFSVPPSR